MGTTLVSGRQPDEPDEVGARDLGLVLRLQPRELRPVALHLHREEFVAGGEPELEAVPRVLLVRVVGGDALLEDACALARGDERPVGVLRLQTQVRSPRGEVQARRLLLAASGVHGPGDAAAGVHGKGEAGAPLVLVGDVGEDDLAGGRGAGADEGELRDVRVE